MSLVERVQAWLVRWRKLEPPTPHELGRRGELAAARFLRRRGHRIVARRYRSRLGEIDLITRDGETIVFVEVKTRRSCKAGHPAEAVSMTKQRQLTRLALAYLKRHGRLDGPARFDVVAVLWPDGERRPRIEHYRNAFEAVGRGQFFS